MSFVMEQKNILSVDDFDLGPCLYYGEHKSVTKLAKLKWFKKYLAIKIISKTSEKLDNLWPSMNSEIAIHTFLDNSNILRFYGYFEDDANHYFITEIADRGKLFNDMVNYGKYTNERAATYIYQLAHAVNYCHLKKIMHCNINPETIFVISNGQIRLGEFFNCRKFKNNEFCKSVYKTLYYKAPEIIRNQPFTKNIDIWSFGVLLHHMLTENVPFWDEHIEIIKDLEVKEVELDIPENVDSDAKDLISKILVINPNARLSLKQIEEHPYIQRFSEKTYNECKASVEMWLRLDPSDSESTNTNSKSDFDSSWESISDSKSGADTCTNLDSN